MGMARLNMLHVNMSTLKLSYFFHDLSEQEFNKCTFILFSCAFLALQQTKLF